MLCQELLKEKFFSCLREMGVWPNWNWRSSLMLPLLLDLLEITELRVPAGLKFHSRGSGEEWVLCHPPQMKTRKM